MVGGRVCGGEGCVGVEVSAGGAGCLGGVGWGGVGNLLFRAPFLWYCSDSSKN